MLLLGLQIWFFTANANLWLFFLFVQIKDHFGMQFEDFKKSVIDMAYSLIERGFVKKTPQYEEAKKQQAANGSG